MTRFGWLGVHAEGVQALEGLIEVGAAPVAIITLRWDLARARSAAVDYRALARQFALPLYEIASINDESSVALLRQLSLDILFVIGWSQILHGAALRAPRIGAIGAHASLLPHNRGSAPVNWALIRGERVAGNSLMWLAEELDAGDLLDQTTFSITPYDTCATLYERVAVSNREMILRVLPRLLAGERPGRPQPPIREPALPRRRPADGLIDWRARGATIYDFVRALTRPYPGAFGWLDGERWIVWRAARLPDALRATASPGEVIGPMYSPEEAACGQVVACGGGDAIVLVEVESSDGRVLRGRRLSDQPWTGKRWSYEQANLGDRRAS
ncbi:MAG TPA: methionyl-tRNA formyltransferase [bacterium]|nr:methionyl-tRNA formyltransferase [bacterium]